MSGITDTVLLLCTIVFVFWWFRNKDKKFYQTISGPFPIPIIGNALDFRSTKEILKTLQRYTESYGGIVKAHIGPFQKFIIVSDYKFLEYILGGSKLITKSNDYKFLVPWLGLGLLTSDGSKWKTDRRVLTPAFHFQILEQFIEVFESCGSRLLQKLEEQVRKESVDIYPLVTLCALDVICESTMGIRINAQIHGESEYVQSVKDMTRIIMERSTSPIQMYDFLYPLSKNYYTQRKALKILHTQTNSVIVKRKKELENSTAEDMVDDFGIKKKKAFLDLLLDIRVDGKPLTHEEIREQVDTFMFEGHDTTASAISFALYCLANHKDVQEQVLKEQIHLFGDYKNATVKYNDLQNMKYLEQVIKETLRLYPSVPVYARKITSEIEFGDLRLPEGDTIIIYAYGIQRNPKYFENPDQFDPTRFDKVDGKLPYSYIPFSAGPRNCIGQRFAILEMKATISSIIRKFELQPAIPNHDLQLVSESILKSANGIKISLKSRK